mgnify:CR=1 FL=1|tara:strand:- start:132 stop:665 length:534 start_codon:yes stop_codon:yes gene_type:complete
MQTNTIALRYAKSFAQLAEKEGLSESEVGFSAVLELLALPEVKTVMNSNVLPEDLKLQLLDYATAQSNAPRVVSQFLHTVVKSGRASLLSQIIKSYHDLLDETRGRAKAVLTVAKPLSKGDLEALKKALEHTFSRSLLFDVVEDPDILGGFVVSVGNQRLDMSLAERFNKLTKHIAV